MTFEEKIRFMVQYAWDCAIAALRWWQAELQAMLPLGISRLLDHGTPDVCLYVDRDGVRLRSHGANGTLWSDREVTNPLSARAPTISQQMEVPATISSALTFRTIIDLPEAAEPNLDRILDHHIGLVVPSEPADILFDYMVLQRDRDQQSLAVALCVIKRETLTKLVRWSQEHECTLGSITVANDKNIASRFEFNRDYELRSRSVRHTKRVLTLTGVALVAMNLAAVKWVLINAEAKLAKSVAEVRAQAEPALAIKRELAEKRVLASELAAILNKTPTLTVLNTLAQTLPDSAWLSDVRISHGSITIGGNAESVSGLIHVFEQSGTLRNPQFVAPITKWQDGSERFEMSVEADIQ